MEAGDRAGAGAQQHLVEIHRFVKGADRLQGGRIARIEGERAGQVDFGNADAGGA